jgi:adenine-specific DNA-methyltransferase
MPAIKSTNQETNKNKYGQYFTPIDVANFMVELTEKPKNCEVLDPCCGTGVFLEALSQKGYTNLSAFEIDKNLQNPFDFVKYRSFIGVKRLHKFDLIIGNPPYIRWRNIEDRLKKELLECSLWNDYCNSLCDYLQIFILKSIELLNDGGELIFICPEYWMHTTHSKAMRNYMLENGYFTKIVHFNEGRIFKGVNVATVVFKYIKCSDEGINATKEIAINKRLLYS